MAVEAINAAGGIKSLGGAHLELMIADSQTKVDAARGEAERPRVAAEYLKRSGGRNFDASGSWDAIQVMGDVLERAASTDPDAIVAAIKKTSFAEGITIANGPVVFNEIGDNPNASTAMIQILGQKPRVVWPRDVAEQKFVFPRPRK